MSANHTPGPYVQRHDCSGYIDVTEGGIQGAIGRFYSLDDAAFAARALNAHDAMREALKAARANLVALYDGIAPGAKYKGGNRHADLDPCMGVIDAALKLAETPDA